VAYATASCVKELHVPSARRQTSTPSPKSSLRDSCCRQTRASRRLRRGNAQPAAGPRRREAGISAAALRAHSSGHRRTSWDWVAPSDAAVPSRRRGKAARRHQREPSHRQACRRATTAERVTARHPPAACMRMRTTCAREPLETWPSSRETGRSSKWGGACETSGRRMRARGLRAVARARMLAHATAVATWARWMWRVPFVVGGAASMRAPDRATGSEPSS